jgi:hypothetical protein
MGYYIYLNNLFTSTKLLELLWSKGHAAIGIYKTISRVILELIELKKKDKGKGEI